MTNNNRSLKLQMAMKKTLSATLSTTLSTTIAGATALSLLIGGNAQAADKSETAENGINKILSGSKEQRQFYTLSVPEGAKDLKIVMTGGTGDADLFVKFDKDPSLKNYECRPYRNGNEEVCDIRLVQAGEYHIMINSLNKYENVNLVASYSSAEVGGSDNIVKK